jgi:hypothetical protein
MVLDSAFGQRQPTAMAAITTPLDVKDDAVRPRLDPERLKQCDSDLTF